MSALEKFIREGVTRGQSRIVSRIIQDERGCWLWRGGRTGRQPILYGHLSVEGKQTRAHRYSYEVFVGPIPEGYVVMHVCDVPLCVNPEHLRLGTVWDNNSDMLVKGRHKPHNKTKTHCVRGHAFNAENTGTQKSGRRCRKCVTVRSRERRAALADIEKIAKGEE